MVQTAVLDFNNELEFEETKNLLLDSYQQYESSFGSKEVFDEYIGNIRVSLYNEGIDKVLIAKIEDKIVGTLQLFLNATTAYKIEGFDVEQPFIRLLAVSPLARHQGVARALIDETIAYLKTLGNTNVFLHTSAIMADAVRLYERYGFERYTLYDFHNEERVVTCYRYTF